MKTKELSDALGVSERMIRKYIDDLSEAGIHVESTPGPTGGYELIGYDYTVNLHATRDEIVALKLAESYLKGKGDFELINQLESLRQKISIINESNLKDDDYSANSVMESKPVYGKKQDNIELTITTARITRNKVRIKYSSVDGGESIRVVRPYDFILRNNAMYLIGFCELKEEIRLFKLLRISEVCVLDERFEVPNDFNRKKFMSNQLGLINDGNIYVKLKIEKPFSYSVSEKALSNNQKITWNNDESINFEADFNGKRDLIRWILSMRTYVTILEPDSLKEEIKRELEEMIKKI
jgi:predicted DNA-binding transcriptional regulator YafY